MALQGNPFLGKLKIPAPDLSRIPETPFEGTVAGPNAASAAQTKKASAVVSESKAEKPQHAPEHRPASRKKPNPPASVAVEPSPAQNEAALDPNRFQTVSIGFSNRFQTVSTIGFNRFQKECDTAPGNLLKPIETYSNRFQTVSAIGFKLPPIGELVVLRYLADLESSVGAPIPLRRREVATATAQTLAGVKTALIRLSKARLLELAEFRCGKANGFTSYRLTAQARTVLASKEASTAIGFNRFQTVSIGFPSSSSSLKVEDLKTTTTDELEFFENTGAQLTLDWQIVDVSPLAEIGFTKTHLIQIIRQGKFTPTEVQDSIHFFAFDLARNGKGRGLNGSPLNFFMGILRKGIPYAPPENYESPADEVRRRTREILERKEHERQADEQRIKNLEFSEWRRWLAAGEFAKVLPEWAQKPGQIQDSAIRAHFDEKVWPERIQEVFGLAKLDRTEIGRQIEQAISEATK